MARITLPMSTEGTEETGNGDGNVELTGRLYLRVISRFYLHASRSRRPHACRVVTKLQVTLL